LLAEQRSPTNAAGNATGIPIVRSLASVFVVCSFPLHGVSDRETAVDEVTVLFEKQVGLLSEWQRSLG
jgi:hypothetical protein